MWDDGDTIGEYSESPDFVRKFIPGNIMSIEEAANLLSERVHWNIVSRLRDQEGSVFCFDLSHVLVLNINRLRDSHVKILKDGPRKTTMMFT